MERKATPDILGAVLAADPEEAERSEVRRRLNWDYGQVSPLHRRTVEDAAVEILISGRRMQQSVMVIGQRLTDVKRLLEHGQFTDWCEREFGMNVRTAQRMMSVAANLDGKSDKLSHLGTSVLYLIGADSTPEPVREAAMAQAATTGKSPTVAEVKALRQEVMQRLQTATPPAPEVQVDGDRPLPEWSAPTPASRYESGLPALKMPIPADDRIGRARRLIETYRATIRTFDEYGNLIGAWTETMAAQRELEKLIRHLEREISLLQGKVVEEEWA